MHIISGELRKAPYIKSGLGQDGQSTMFAVELSEMVKDFKTDEKTYTNYKAVLFAKSPGHVDYLTSTLVEGNFIVLNSEKLKVNISDCGKYITLDMDNARLENSGYIESSSTPKQQGGFAKQSPEVPTENDLAWVDLINSKQKTLTDITDDGYRAKIKSFL